MGMAMTTKRLQSLLPSSSQQGGILSLVHGCVREQSSEENVLEQLKKRSSELASQLELAQSDLEEKKEQRNILLEELKSLEVELQAAESLIQSRQARVEAKQAEISEAMSQLDALKREEATERDCFIESMLQLNANIVELSTS